MCYSNSRHSALLTPVLSILCWLFPVLRDYDGRVYLREWSGGIMAGGFEPVGKPIFHDGIPEKFEYQLLPEDWDHFR